MASRKPAAKDTDWSGVMRQSIARSGTLIGAVVLGLATLALVVALLTHSMSDPSFSTAAGGPAENWLGGLGAWVSDALLQVFGPPIGFVALLMLVFTGRLWRHDPQPEWKSQLVKCLIGIVLIGTALTLAQPDPWISLPAGWGGLLGFGAASGLGKLFALAGEQLVTPLRWLSVILLGGFGIRMVAKSLQLDRPMIPSIDWSFGKEKVPALPHIPDPNEAQRRQVQPRAEVQREERAPPTIAEPAKPISIAQPKPAAPRQTEMFGSFSLPPLDLLTPAPPSSGPLIDKASLEKNARLLESVLEDFSVKGQIVAVRPGPVVTMYELEPAPGTKASRVSNLAEDIARNMSAMSARIAPIPGRTVIGIELPNTKRESVVLHEMIGSEEFADQTAQLPIVLGKNIFGDPVVTDLAPMPHLLVAGTTGSGKSVGLNCMILSLLYRMTPDQCRMIMIDPKMLELSIYDGIPHLLSPVVTEPQKAVRALKWAVEQMEDRYRMMSSLSVRNLANYNEKVKAAIAKGKPLGRRVQTGYDNETGQPIYEEEQLDYAPLPQIVVVVDELADLMMTAGKEVEFLIQRLAQKARAAGIHLIMATQRPSVDVITGVIKANLPTRISFAVTSKIDSRTILGEQGAEQLLGKGDMLYMPGGKGLQRVHGPFVSDDEVRAIADHWRAQGQPEYIQSVTEEPEDGGFALEGAPSGDDSAEDRQYRKACQIVIDSQKASTSWLQRQLRIGYNSAARLIERMEEEGVVSAPNHVGRRDVLIDQHGQPR